MKIVFICLALGMMSGGFYNDVFASNTVENNLQQKCQLTSKEANALIKIMEDNGSCTLVIPNHFKSIKKDAFVKCEQLASVIIPESVQCIENGAFIGCNQLREVTILGKTNTLKQYSFVSCKNLKSIYLCKKDKYLNDYNIGSKDNPIHLIELFNKPNVVVPQVVQNIHSDMFSDKVESIIIPNSVQSIDRRAFANCRKLQDVFVYSSRVSELLSNTINKDKIHLVTNPVSIIKSEQFIYRDDENSSEFPTEIVVDNRYTSIKGIHSKHIKQVKIPNSITSIDQITKNGIKVIVPCEGMKKYLEEHLKVENVEVEKTDNAGNTWAWNLNKEGHLKIPDGVEYISDYMFYGRKDIKSINIPNSVRWIGDNAFEKCWAKRIEIPDSIIYISDLGKNLVKREVDNCNKNEIVDIQTSEERLGVKWRLNKCKYISIPNNVTSIGDKVLSECNAKYIIIPNSVKSIGDPIRALPNTHYIVSCENMKNYLSKRGVSSENISIDRVLTNAIDDAWWWNVDENGHLSIPDGIEHIDDYMFIYRKDIKSISIPNSVKTIGKGAFCKCNDDLMFYVNDKEVFRQVVKNYVEHEKPPLCKIGNPDYCIETKLYNNDRDAYDALAYRYIDRIKKLYETGNYNDTLKYFKLIMFLEADCITWDSTFKTYLQNCINIAKEGDKKMLNTIAEIISYSSYPFNDHEIRKLLLEANIENLLCTELVNNYTHTLGQSLNTYSNMYRIFGINDIDKAFKIWENCREKGLNYDDDVAKIILNASSIIAQQGDTNMQERLAEIYNKGRFVARDINEAAKYYAMLVNNGNVDAQQRLVELLQDGMVPNNRNVQSALFSIGINCYNAGLNQSAFDCCLAAYNYGYTDAAIILGLMYEEGRVPNHGIDLRTAINYYIVEIRSASNEGNKNIAQQKLQAIIDQLFQQQHGNDTPQNQGN